MTTTTEMFDALKAYIITCISSDYVEIENPVIPEDNASNLWDKGFGLAIGPGVNPELLVKPETTCVRDFTVILINKVNFTQTDVEGFDDLQKALIDDMDSIKRCIDDSPEIGGICAKAALLSDTGVGFIDGERNKFMICEGSIEVTYFE